ncbi:MAG: thioredoxin [Myxococcota bacterium]
MADQILHVTDGDFDSQVLKGANPTLVDFWAEWCAPCRALSPIVEKVAAGYQGRLQVAKMNIDEHPRTPGKYGIRAIPTLLLFKDGAVVDQVVGLVSQNKLEQIISKHL